MRSAGTLDVAKTTLDVALRPSGEQWSVPNDEAGVAALVDRLCPLHRRQPLPRGQAAQLVSPTGRTSAPNGRLSQIAHACPVQTNYS